jgi:hypothetical protein
MGGMETGDARITAALLSTKVRFIGQAAVLFLSYECGVVLGGSGKRDVGSLSCSRIENHRG